MLKRLAMIGTGLAAMAAAGAAWASEEVAGKPVPAGTGFQRPVTEQMADLVWLDDMLLVIITAITLFVTALILYVVWKFDARKNPEPARFTHNATIEVVWTAIPVVILVIIAIPSLRLLDKQVTIPETEITIKAIGNQWYWDYQYPDADVEFSAYMLERDELEEYGYESDEYLLATDTRMVVPVDTNIHLLVTASDVIHNWAMPSFGIKTDAIPGRVNEAWFNVTETGTFFGQCSELCGMQHAYMPIVVEVVTREEYDDWIAEQQARRDGGAALAAAPAETVLD